MPTSAQFEKLYKALNEGQRTAVDTLEGPVMVLAGPGTGKTQTLAMRIANILKETQMDPWNILCLTFTESGVAAMRSRLLTIIGTPAYYVRIHTFHSFCNDIMQEHPDIFATGDSWHLISDAEKVECFQAIVDALPEGSPLKPFYAPYLYFNDTTSAIADLKQENISPQVFQEILHALGVFFGAVLTQSEAFFALTPKQRTYEACQDLREHIRGAFLDAGVKESVAYAVEQIFVRYEEEHEASEGAREQSKSRTKLKNSVKDWLITEQKNLERNKALASVYAEYEAMLIRSGMYDYEDMISRTVLQLRKNNELLREYQEQFQYILVDEYQDTNGGQNAVVELLGSFDDSPNIFVVGDDKQSIYRFQGASLANMLLFYERYKDSVRVVSLTENYRSQKIVIDAADALIARNTESLGAHIPGIAQQLSPGKKLPECAIDVITTESEDQEAYVIGQKIQHLLTSGVQSEDIAVLYRYNSDGASLLETLRRVDVPARIEMGENIFFAQSVIQWTLFLEWLAGTSGDDGLARIIQYPWWNIPSLDVLKVLQYSGSNYTALLTVLSSREHLEKAEVSDIATLQAVAERIAEFKRESVLMPLMEFLEHVMKETGWMNTALVEKDSVAALRAMKRFLNEAKELSSTHTSYTVSDFVRHLAFLRNHNLSLLTSAWEGGVGAVHLMSAHKAKGLEWPHVFVMRMNDKHWGNPKKRSGIALPEGLVRYDFVFLNDRNEDERRLFYVALTRAMLTCTLTRSAHSATGKETVPSIFLSEIPQALISSEEYAETPAMQEQRLLASMVVGEASLVPEDERAYIRSSLTQYMMSATHLNNYLSCPRKFYWRNVLQIPAKKGRSLMLGTAVHDTLRDVFERMSSGKGVPEPEVLISLFEMYLRREAMSEIDFKEILSKGTKAVLGYALHYKNEFLPDVLLEHNFKKYHVQIGEARITGKLDKIEIISKENKLVNVVDYKTGNSNNAWEKVRKDGDYFRQLVFYKLLCDNAKQFGYTMQSGEIDFVEPSKKGYVKKRIEITKADTDNLAETISRVWQEIQDLKFMDPINGCHKADCEYCG